MSRLTGKTVTFGTKVVIADEETDAESTYVIVGPYEADISKHMISTSSPIARALIGKAEGDSVRCRPRAGHIPMRLSLSR